MDQLTFVIPFRTDNGERQEIFNWNIARLNTLFPQSKIVVGESPPGPFNRSAACNDGILKVETELLAVLDADTVWNKELLIHALTQLENYATWNIPYSTYHVTSHNFTQRQLHDSPGCSIHLSTETDVDHILRAVPGDLYPPVSGICFMHTESMYKVGGFDPRFVGWGFEDRAFFLSANKILGNASRGFGEVFHLYHSVGNITNHENFKENEHLFGKYITDIDSVLGNHLK